MSNIGDTTFLSSNKHEFDLLSAPKRARVGLERIDTSDFQLAIELARSEIPGELAADDAVLAAAKHNPNNILLFKRGNKIVGFWAMLMLNSRGIEALLLGELNREAPPKEFLCVSTEVPSAIYVWAVVAPGIASEGIRHVAQFLQQPLYSAANFYSRPNTDIGIKLNKSLGFRPIGISHPGFYRYVRFRNRPHRIDQDAA